MGTLDPALRVKTLRTAKVTVQIVPAPLEQTVRDRPVHLRNLAASLDGGSASRRTLTSRFAEVARRSRGFSPTMRRRLSICRASGAGDYTLTVHAESSRDAGVARIEPADNSGADQQCQELKAGPATRSPSNSPSLRHRRHPGTAGTPPLDPPTVRRIGAALVRALPRGTGSAASSPRLLIGRDTRESGAWIEMELAHGAGGEGASVTSAGVVPTPAVAYLTRTAGYDAGVVISASHNPFEDNGIKVFSGRGEKFTERVEREVEAIVADSSWRARDGQTAAGCRRRTSSARISITCARCFRRRPRCLAGGSPDGRFADRLRERRDDDRRAGVVRRAWDSRPS